MSDIVIQNLSDLKWAVGMMVMNNSRCVGTIISLSPKRMRIRTMHEEVVEAERKDGTQLKSRYLYWRPVSEYLYTKTLEDHIERLEDIERKKIADLEEKEKALAGVRESIQITTIPVAGSIAFSLEYKGKTIVGIATPYETASFMDGRSSYYKIAMHWPSDWGTEAYYGSVNMTFTYNTLQDAIAEALYHFVH